MAREFGSQQRPKCAARTEDAALPAPITAEPGTATESLRKIERLKSRPHPLVADWVAGLRRPQNRD